MNLDSIVVLWRQPDILTLWGIPYDMRPGQSPYDLWKARRDYVEPPAYTYGSLRISLDDWIPLGLVPEEQCLEIRNFLTTHKDNIPHYPCEWTYIG